MAELEMIDRGLVLWFNPDDDMNVLFIVPPDGVRLKVMEVGLAWLLELMEIAVMMWVSVVEYFRQNPPTLPMVG